MTKSKAQTVATTPSAAGGNAEAVFNDLVTRVGKLGEAEGMGANSRPELAMEVAKAAAEGLLQPNYSTDKSNDVHKVWEAFSEARAAAKHDGGKDKSDTSNPASFKAQVSKLNAIAKCGALMLKDQPVDGFDTLSRTRAMLAAGKVDTKLSAYDALVLVARKQLEQGEVPLDDAELKGIVSPKAPNEETDDERELRVLTGSIKTMEKLKDGTEELEGRPSPELESALENLRARVNALQFTIDTAAANAKREQFLKDQAAKQAALIERAAHAA
jgi:hypothetical protein